MKATKRTTRTETRRSDCTSVETFEDDAGARPAEPGGTTSTLSAGVPHQAVAPFARNWHHLESFYIEDPPTGGSGDISTVQMFANGRQQLPIVVILSPRNANGEFVDVPADELRASMTLVKHGDGSPLPTGWRIETVKNTYRYDGSFFSRELEESTESQVPRVARARAGGLARDQVEVTLYLVTSIYDASQTLAVSILPPGASRPIQTRPGASGDGAFDSALRVLTRKPPTAQVGVPIGYDGFSVEGKQRFDNGFVRVNDHYISLVYRGQPIALKKLVRVNGWVPTIWWDTSRWGPWTACFSLTAQPETLETVSDGVPGLFAFSYDNTWRHVYDWFPIPVTKARPGVLDYVVVGVTEPLTFYYSDKKKAPDNYATKLDVIDEFGNSYRLKIAYRTDAPDAIEVTASI